MKGALNLRDCSSADRFMNMKTGKNKYIPILQSEYIKDKNITVANK
jgi:hypothetical protein